VKHERGKDFGLLQDFEVLILRARKKTIPVEGFDERVLHERLNIASSLFSEIILVQIYDKKYWNF